MNSTFLLIVAYSFTHFLIDSFIEELCLEHLPSKSGSLLEETNASWNKPSGYPPLLKVPARCYAEGKKSFCGKAHVEVYETILGDGKLIPHGRDNNCKGRKERRTHSREDSLRPPSSC